MTTMRRGAVLGASLAVLLAASPAAAVISYEFVGQPFNRLQAFVLKSPDFVPSPSDIPAAALDSCAAAFSSCDHVLLFDTADAVAVLFYEVDLIQFSYFFPGARLDRLGFYQSSTASGLPGLLNITGTVDLPPPPPAPGVPEPAAWAMMVVGFGAAGAAVRRRRGAVP